MALPPFDVPGKAPRGGNMLYQAAVHFGIIYKYSTPHRRKQSRPRPGRICIFPTGFGAYLVHPLVLEQLNKLGFNTLSFNPALSVVCIGVIIFIISICISAVLNRIPIVKK